MLPKGTEVAHRFSSHIRLELLTASDFTPTHVKCVNTDIYINTFANFSLADIRKDATFSDGKTMVIEVLTTRI